MNTKGYFEIYVKGKYLQPHQTTIINEVTIFGQQFLKFRPKNKNSNIVYMIPFTALAGIIEFLPNGEEKQC